MPVPHSSLRLVLPWQLAQNSNFIGVVGLWVLLVSSLVSALPPVKSEAPSSRHQLASLPIWRDGKSEWLTYTVQAPRRGHTWEGEARVMLKPLLKKSKLEGFEMQWSRRASGNLGGYYDQTELHWSLATDQIEKARFLRGQLPGEISAMHLQKGEGGYQLSHWQGDKPSLLKSPLLLEESLFLEVRNWPLQPEFTREVWWYPVASAGNAPKEAVYARIEVVGGMQVLRDTQVWKVVVKPAKGRGAEIFVQCGGSHAVLQATLSDGATFHLEKVERR